MDLFSLGWGAAALGHAVPFFSRAPSNGHRIHVSDADLANCTVRSGPNDTEAPNDRLYNERCRRRLLGQGSAREPLDLRSPALRAKGTGAKARRSR